MDVLARTTLDLRATIKEGRIWAALIISVGLFALAGPFGSYGVLDFWGRLGMWACVTGAAFAVGVPSFFLIRNLFPVEWARHPVVVLAAAVLTSLPVSIMAVFVDNLYLGAPITSERLAIDWQNLIPFVGALVLLIGLTRTARLAQQLREAEQTPHPPFLERIGKKIGTDLLYLSSQDHYIAVKTSRGSELVLMRFGDAVSELANYDGLQIHRSHWVARAAITGVERKNGRLLVVIRDGTRLPVSRAFQPALRATTAAAGAE